MKILFAVICSGLALSLQAQTTITKSYATQPDQRINLKFDYPVIKISTWAKNEVSVIAHVKINDDENDGAFSLDEKTVDSVMTISDQIKDIDKLPRRHIIVVD